MNFLIAVTVIALKDGRIPSITLLGGLMASDATAVRAFVFVDRTGRVRYYFRHKGRRWSLPGDPGSKEFGAAYDARYQQHIARV